MSAAALRAAYLSVFALLVGDVSAAALLVAALLADGLLAAVLVVAALLVVVLLVVALLTAALLPAFLASILQTCVQHDTQAARGTLLHPPQSEVSVSVGIETMVEFGVRKPFRLQFRPIASTQRSAISRQGID